MKEKILLNVNSGTESEIMCSIASYPLRETRQQGGETGFSYEADVKKCYHTCTEWMNTNLIAEGGTNLLLTLKQSFDMLGKTGESIPLIFLITDGSVEDEKDICSIVKNQLVDEGINSP
uniref:von Willebrand factor, type A n=1 Tax=Tanacetum cinerariifolium TaxID=118510 RepID=A0A6L2MFP5_TANCI|nr:von Willebrand factor, type A [Tanacetum cinerariifolium]